MKSDLQALEAFHGHLGPMVVAGLRMGQYALKRLQATPHFGIEAEVWYPNDSVSSSLLDGIQLATGCTLGKGNIRYHFDDEIRALFRNRNTNAVVLLALRPEAIRRALVEMEAKGNEAGSALVQMLAIEELLEELKAD